MTVTRSSLVRLLAAGALAATAVPAAAAAQAPAPPGPPPGNGGDLPAPPGTAPAFVPPGTPAAVPSGATGPGLIGSGDVAFNRAKRTFSVPFACQAGGRITVSARAASNGPIARAPYKCSGGRASAALSVSGKIGKRLAKLQTVAATAAVTQSNKATRMSLTLHAGGGAAASTAGFWTDGHLQCTDSAGAPNAYLVEPDFTTATPTTISTRGWIAWYLPAGGWHWLGVGGENAGRWDTWSAASGGITQFHPGGAVQPSPWTWGPVTIPTGEGTFAVGVYEVVYWVGGHPQHRWQYVNAGTTGAAAAGGGTLYCAY
jgi:hypothetical protein